MINRLRSVLGSDHWISCDRLTLGWSTDEKYIIRTDAGETLLLRTAAPEQYEFKRREYEFVKQVYALGVNCSRPTDFGLYETGVYTLYSWIEGESLETALTGLSPEHQYALGLEAGRALRLIHTIPAPENRPEWSEYMNRKFDRKIRGALECPLEIPGRDRMIEYVNAHRHLLENRPQTMHHGDYHRGNLILTSDGHIGVIDFNRFDAGDPWEEFNRIVWCAQVSPAFASGRINGYFENNVPDDFFPLVTAYILSNQLSSLPWAIPFGQQEIDVMLRQANEVLGWYEDLSISAVPSWYISPEKWKNLPLCSL